MLSDIHLNLFDRSARPSNAGSDTNGALFESFVVQMKRSVPNPAVILLPGDLLMHHFARNVRATGETSDAAGLQTMGRIARRLQLAFPDAQFAIAIGNNDTPCGDYKSGDGSAYQSALARIWAPLVNRRGASPQFAATFGRDGYYTAKLPVPGLQLVVLNTVLFSDVYRGNCGAYDRGAAVRQLRWLANVLTAVPATRNVVMMHIPPGYDAFATDYVYGLIAWPFLHPKDNRALIATLSASRDRVAYAVAGHTHRFDFRLADGVPVLVFGSLSPVYYNDPSFSVLRVSPSGSLRDIEMHPFDEAQKTWLPVRDFDRLWGVSGIDASSLTRLHERLAGDPRLRSIWEAQAVGWPSDPSLAAGAWRSAWRLPWCAQDLLVTNFAECAGIENRGWTLVVLLIVAVGAVTMLAFIVHARRARQSAAAPRA